METNTPTPGVVLGRPDIDLAPIPTIERATARRTTLLEIFAATVARWPMRTALEGPDATYTYAELDAAADAVASKLTRHGIGPGDRVVVHASSGRAELYLAILGVLRAGAAYVPIDADDPSERVRDIIERSGACAVLRDGLTVELCRTPSGRSGEQATGDDDAWVIFTSGTTGAPKGVAVAHRSAAAFVDAEADLWEVLPSDRVLAGLSVGFDASCEEIWLAWAHGAALLPAPRAAVRAGVELGAWLIEHRVTVVSTVPTLAALWDESCLHDVRLLILGGEACPEKLGWRLAAGREVWNTYGPTEATVVSTAGPIIPGEPITIGWPLGGWEVAVLDGERAVEDGQTGELVIGGIGLGRYLDPELDAERYAAVDGLGWERAYRTGDIVRVGERGLEFVGRRDDQVKIGGRRIELGEIEAALRAAPGVSAAAVAVRESGSGNRLLVGYIVAEHAVPEDVRQFAAHRLPAGLLPLVVALPELPMSASGKVNRRALPWPVGDDAATLAAGIGADGTVLSDHEVWVGERWTDQLGPVPLGPNSDFFAAGGTSLAAAKLISVVRRHFPAVAVADLYRHPTLRTFARRLEEIGPGAGTVAATSHGTRPVARLLQLACLLSLFLLDVPSWLGGILALDRLFHVGPQLGWGWILGGWFLLSNVGTHSLIAAGGRRLLLRGVTPGRHPRGGWTAFRVVFLERLAERCRLDGVAGTPWATRYARLVGHDVAADARLGTLPPASSFTHVGAGATLEGDVDLHGWWIEGGDLVIGEVRVGARARIGTRSVLMPGADVEAGAEVEAGAVISGRVPAGERWAGSPAVCVGRAGATWPVPWELEAAAHSQRRWRVMYGVGLLVDMALPLLAAVPEITLLLAAEQGVRSTTASALIMLAAAPLLALLFTVSLALLIAGLVRAVGRLIVPGWHHGLGPTPWALWLTDQLMAESRTVLFPLYASSFTNRWLRLCGIRVGARTEISTAVGINRLTSFGERSFAADDVVCASARARDGWLHVATVSVGSGTFLGNSAILLPETRVGDASLIGLMTVAPVASPDATSWLGVPPLELPRRPACVDPARTVAPPLGLRLGRTAMDLIRILFPTSVATAIGALTYWTLDTAGARLGIPAMALAAVPTLILTGVIAVLITAAVKWGLMGRYTPGEHPFFSFYVWRDEIVNTCQEQLAGPMLMGLALGSALMPAYLRLLGAEVGRDVWVDTLTTTEFDLASFGDGCAVNRNAVVETHLFHDRLMSTGPVRIGVGATLGPSSVSLPETVLGDGTVVGARSIVMRGEELPAGSRWHGAPVVAQ
ncbi:MAG TPA: Pls/PosA family non-ribosomal peptide synthetase [Solirubrobacteraceae bacterium]|nr:Pls/PosA family non-ribosomal peptide synthetase [Solirubrobacteraceae bacterium]